MSRGGRSASLPRMIRSSPSRSRSPSSTPATSRARKKRSRGTRRTKPRAFPPTLDYDAVRGLSIEVRQKLKQQRPETVGQASRISGVTPAAISLLLVHLKRLVEDTWLGPTRGLTPTRRSDRDLTCWPGRRTRRRTVGAQARSAGPLCRASGPLERGPQPDGDQLAGQHSLSSSARFTRDPAANGADLRRKAIAECSMWAPAVACPAFRWRSPARTGK